MAPNDVAVISKKFAAMLEDAGIPPAEHAELATASMRETAAIILEFAPVSQPPADGNLSLRALAPGLEKAGLAPRALPAGWTSLRVLALAARVLELRHSGELQRAFQDTQQIVQLISNVCESISEDQAAILSHMRD